MVKKIGMFQLAKGKDSDEVWKYWIETHAAQVKTLPGLRKYTINRVKSVTKGDVHFWGVAELWFDTEEDYDKAFSHLVPDEFGTLVTDPRLSVWVEEKVIV
ncbi:MAG: hypothetical protein CMI58_03020 [Parcubacteria group bacterium]|jgi:uncharacterized protein (TIGR02118 family)|nr:hypothetical protein [Parcubacteria group bacterium]|tara:strand:- start:59 stop:361 length:303 start_codon:yes stop_codon:yes gene_type:complete